MARSDWLLELRISFVSIDILKQWIASRARSDWLLECPSLFTLEQLTRDLRPKLL